MTDGLLENIIQLEKRIQSELANEKERAENWQRHELDDLQAALAAAQKAEEDRHRQVMAEAKAELLQEGKVLEAAANAWCQRLSELDDAVLRDVLKRHLAEILPGGEHDHPHGQSRNRRPQTGPS